MTGRPLLDPDTVPQAVAAVAIALVGSYAIRVTWTDGHDSGIYTYDWLRAHCPCEACVGPDSEDDRAPSLNG